MKKTNMVAGLKNFVKSLHEQHQNLVLYKELEKEDFSQISQVAEMEGNQLMETFKK